MHVGRIPGLRAVDWFICFRPDAPAGPLADVKPAFQCDDFGPDIDGQRPQPVGKRHWQRKRPSRWGVWKRHLSSDSCLRVHRAVRAALPAKRRLAGGRRASDGTRRPINGSRGHFMTAGKGRSL